MGVITSAAPSRRRTLVLADWRADPGGVIAACRDRAADGEMGFALVVPGWLHGIDWAGDPYASRPCAARQLEALVRLSATVKLDVELAQVGDPDPTSAVDDALETFGATDILVCRDRMRLRHPLDLAHRLRRMTGLPVETLGLPAGTPRRAWRSWRALTEGGHCAAAAR
jgi:hypothetical protein